MSDPKDFSSRDTKTQSSSSEPVQETLRASRSPLTHPATAPPDPSTAGPAIASYGTLIDDQFRIVDNAGEPGIATALHMTQVEAIDERIEANQSDSKQKPFIRGYKLLHQIGKGAYGTVWEAQSVGSEEEHVAIKFFTHSQWQAMHREIGRIARLEGTSGVVTFKHYAAKNEDPPYYVMPYARNGSLADLLKQRGPLPVSEALKLFGRIVETMAFVHSKGVIHCDLKPANILLNESGEPLVADFGQATLNSAEEGAFGTLFYMPPDQASTDRPLPDSNWDVYALGALLFEMLTGRKPRASAETIETLSRITHLRLRLAAYADSLKKSARVSLRAAVREAVPQRAKQIDPALSALVESCLSIDPARRPRSASEIAQRLKLRSWWLQRRPALLVGVAVTLVAIITLAGLGAYAANQVVAEHEHQIKEQVQQSLDRTAHITSQLVMEKLQDRVQFIQASARVAPEEMDVEAIPVLAEKVRTHAAEAIRSGKPALSNDERKPLNAWLMQRSGEMPWSKTPGTSRGMVLLGITENRGYILSLLDKNGVVEQPTLANNARIFHSNFAWRDYFNGTGTRFEDQDTDITLPPIERCHISQVFRSRSNGRWQIVVSAPIRNGAGKIVALVLTSVDVQGDLLAALNESRNVHDLSENQDKPKRHREDIILVNDRGCWFWHPRADFKKYEQKDPEPLYTDERQPWLYHADQGEGRYDDVFPEYPDKPGCLASFAAFYPYRAGEDEDLADKKWFVIAQMSEENAHESLQNMRQKLISIGIVALAITGSLAIGLWTWWIRVLRRQEVMHHA